MGKLYAFLALSFIFLFVINIIFVSLTIYAWVTDGIQDLLIGMELGERIESSNQIKWIILADITWLFFALVFLLKRKHYRTNSSDYLSSNIIKKRKITVVIPAYNEENNVESIITDYKSQKNVENIIVVDNHSSDNTVQIAKKMGAIIVEKESNKGFADSCLMGLKKSLETDANIIVLTECDGTYAGHDIEKLVPFLDECDVAIGSRLIQVLTEKGNQNGMFNTWGNFFLAKLIQIKYFSLLHMGIVSFTDVGCTFRCIRREALEKIIDGMINDYKKNIDTDGWLFLPYFNMIGIEKELKIIEVPITFKKRHGKSKSQVNRKHKGIMYGLKFMWFIIKT
jgi:glycosyltransferase involved in cell wall biosynthesis|tara:strand:+ start:808 stop:1824 length:1017 start_codon:yes stop_codon:yes gene_type:complete